MKNIELETILENINDAYDSNQITESDKDVLMSIIECITESAGPIRSFRDEKTLIANKLDKRIREAESEIKHLTYERNRFQKDSEEYKRIQSQIDEKQEKINKFKHASEKALSAFKNNDREGGENIAKLRDAIKENNPDKIAHYSKKIDQNINSKIKNDGGILNMNKPKEDVTDATDVETTKNIIAKYERYSDTLINQCRNLEAKMKRLKDSDDVDDKASLAVMKKHHEQLRHEYQISSSNITILNKKLKVLEKSKEDSKVSIFKTFKNHFFKKAVNEFTMEDFIEKCSEYGLINETEYSYLKENL